MTASGLHETIAAWLDRLPETLSSRNARPDSGAAHVGVGLAVSGGGDSMAMLHLLAPFLRDRRIPAAVATVDHGLRPEAVAEARFVAETCATLGLTHDILRWSDWDGQGNLSAAARNARYALLADWARGRGLSAITLAHTQDDQAETLLMRLARGSGVDGLSGMAAERDANGVRWLRPLLGVRRQILRDWLQARGLPWVEDPSNLDPTYDRVKTRQALAVLEGLGISAERLSATANRMSCAREALRHMAIDSAGRIAQETGGALVIDRRAMAELPLETKLRLMAEALRWVASAPYRPRLSALEPLLDAALSGGSGTLHGAIVTGSRGCIVIARELRAAAGLETLTTAIWDKRWRLDGPHAPGLTVRALGAEGLRACKSWRDTGLPQVALLATPAIWRGGALVAAPCAGEPAGWSATVIPDFESFLKSD